MHPTRPSSPASLPDVLRSLAPLGYEHERLPGYPEMRDGATFSGDRFRRGDIPMQALRDKIKAASR